MDRQTTIGFVLIAIVFIIWMFMTMDQTPEPVKPPKEQEEVEKGASIRDEEKKKQTEQDFESAQRKDLDSTRESPHQLLYGKWFSDVASGTEEVFTIETEKYIAEFTTRGGGIKRWTLKDFSTWNKQPLQLIDWKIPSDFSLLFGTSDGKLIDTKDLYFKYAKGPAERKMLLTDTAKYTFELILPVKNAGGEIVKRFTVKSGGYDIDVDIEMKNMERVIANYEYQVTIHSLALTEQNSVEEASFAEADAMVDADRIKMDASDAGKDYRENVSGKAHWISTHNKYFLNAIIARDGYEGSGVYLEGKHVTLRNNGAREIYQASIKVKYLGVPYEKSRFSLFIGPMEYDLLKSQHEGLEQVLSLGWAWVVRPFSEYLIIPLFTFLHSFIPNYGIVIILFSLIIKLLLYPLTKKSMESMSKMQLLQPMMTEIREKYKDDQQRQNTEMMKLYKDYGVNPAGGCLPLLLQMPILIALFTTFRSTIELRQQPFISWITDLSSMDVMFNLPFTMPIMGTSAISGLALFMAITMFIQQKQSVKDPRQKTMVYMMPVMFWFMFNGFPSGLNLYYFMFNLFSIAQQYYLTKKKKGEPLQKVAPKKGKRKGWAERAMESLQEKAKEQQKMRRK